jgi:hypothetical protein
LSLPDFTYSSFTYSLSLPPKVFSRFCFFDEDDTVDSDNSKGKNEKHGKDDGYYPDTEIEISTTTSWKGKSQW